MNLEEKVRAAMQGLADDAPVVAGLADRARAQGRGIRRRRQAGMVASGLVLIAAMVTPFAVLHRTTKGSPPIVTATATASGDWWASPYKLPDGMVVTSLSGTGKTLQTGNIVLDRQTSTYRVLKGSYAEVLAAPQGPYAVVELQPGHIAVIDANEHRYGPTMTTGPSWSPDGTELLLSTLTGFAVRDAASGRQSQFAEPAAMSACGDDCWSTWMAGGKNEVAIAEGKDIAIYSSVTGKRLRSVPVAEAPMHGYPWSADGDLVLTYDPAATAAPKSVVNTTTGKVSGKIPGQNLWFTRDGHVLSIAGTKAILYDLTGKVLQTQILPADFANRYVSVGTL